MNKKLKQFCEKHPLNAAFVMEAIAKYAEQILKNKDDVKRDMTGGFINPDDWIAIAEEASKL